MENAVRRRRALDRIVALQQPGRSSALVCDDLAFEVRASVMLSLRCDVMLTVRSCAHQRGQRSLGTAPTHPTRTVAGEPEAGIRHWTLVAVPGDP